MSGAAPSATPSIRVRNLRTVYGDTVVHDGLDLEVKAGEILGVVGGSGAGKSVLLSGSNGPMAAASRFSGRTLPIRRRRARWSGASA